jgi:hypothetical protein
MAATHLLHAARPGTRTAVSGAGRADPGGAGDYADARAGLHTRNPQVAARGRVAGGGDHRECRRHCAGLPHRAACRAVTGQDGPVGTLSQLGADTASSAECHVPDTLMVHGVGPAGVASPAIRWYGPARSPARSSGVVRRLIWRRVAWPPSPSPSITSICAHCVCHDVSATAWQQRDPGG